MPEGKEEYEYTDPKRGREMGLKFLERAKSFLLIPLIEGEEQVKIVYGGEDPDIPELLKAAAWAVAQLAHKNIGLHAQHLGMLNFAKELVEEKLRREKEGGGE